MLHHLSPRDDKECASSLELWCLGLPRMVFEMGSQEEMLVQRVCEIYEKIASLPSLNPSKEVNVLFTQLVLACIPPSSIDVSKLSKGVQEMKSKLIRLCGEAEGLLETHYSTILGSFDHPLDHLNLFPYYQNYVKLSLLEYNLMARHVARPPSSVAFVGSGPLPLSTIVLATSHLRAARFHNYDLDEAANARALRLVAPDPDLSARVSFHTADILSVTTELRDYDVIFLAALVGMGREEKVRVIAHLARHMAPGKLLVMRSAHGARVFLYPVVDPCRDLLGFEVLDVHHPTDEVINSVVVARKHQYAGVPAAAEQGPGPACMCLPCKCAEIRAFNPLVHGCMMEELAIKEQLS